MIKGKTEPRVWTPPLAELTKENSLGFAFIDFCEALGVELLPWQKWLAIHALETVSEGDQWRFRYRYVIILISRQNGKTFFEVLLNIFFLFGLQSHLVLGTAQNLDTAVETFEDTVAQVEDIPELKELLKKVNRGTGKRELLLENGDRYKVIAATRKARGLSSDLIMMDELREQVNWDAWGAISKTMIARPTAILFGLSNAGDVSSVVLRHLRLQAHAQLGDPDGVAANRRGLGGEDIGDDTLGLFEWSAVPDCALDDVEQWAQANPSLNYGFLTERALRSAMITDPEPIFRTECLCQWVESRLPEPFPDGAWQGGVDENSYIDEASELFWGIDMSQDRKWTCIAVCGLRADGNYHIEIAERRIGTEWAVDWFRQRVGKYGGMKLAFQERGAPVSGLAEQICTIDGIERMAQGGPDLTAGWTRFWDAIAACVPEDPRGGVKCYHLPQPVLDTPGRTCQLRNLGGGVQLPDRNKSPDDISPLMACAMAYAGATQITNKKERKVYESTYANGGGVMFI
jgi:hypothetical protein